MVCVAECLAEREGLSKQTKKLNEISGFAFGFPHTLYQPFVPRVQTALIGDVAAQGPDLLLFRSEQLSSAPPISESGRTNALR